MMEGAKVKKKISAGDGIFKIVDARTIPSPSIENSKIPEAYPTEKSIGGHLVPIKTVISTMQATEFCPSDDNIKHMSMATTYVDSPLAKLVMRANYT